MNNYSKSTLNIIKVLLLVLICFLLGPELYLFMPEIVILFDVAVLEMLIFFIVMRLQYLKDHIVIWAHIIGRNRKFRNYGMLILCVAIAPFAPELFLLINVVGIEIALACLLVNFRSMTTFLAKA
ncbi:MAG: hypothetical protein COC19_07700 [SAR86 cluster bacterium]|uniref:Uncharacterized protein n=1 Tax=SAR86 cluster bacterium TaxID=2030880 RepID=A0A2A4MGR3_9GAMM|nr:MAG: hypothetical protein COC19_07700 [SAR86 cluster bacterium]